MERRGIPSQGTQGEAVEKIAEMALRVVAGAFVGLVVRASKGGGGGGGRVICCVVFLLFFVAVTVCSFACFACLLCGGGGARKGGCFVCNVGRLDK